MKKIKIGILDDELLAMKRLTNCISHWAENAQCEIEYYIPLSTKKIILSELLVLNIIFLDVKLDDKINGIKLAKLLRKQNYIGEIVFITDLHECVFEGYQVKALNYLLKPIILADVENCLNIVWEKLKSEKNNYYLLKTRQSILKIPYHDIIYITSAKHYVDIVCIEQTHSQLCPLKEILLELPPRFIQCHRSTVLNIEHIRSIEGNMIIMSNGDILSVSRTYIQQIREEFIRYASN